MWCDGTYITLWPQNTIWWTNNLKVAYTIHKLWSTVVWPKLPKFITNSKLLKIFWNLLHLYMASSVCQLLSMKIINLKKQYFYTTNPTLKIGVRDIYVTRSPLIYIHINPTSRPLIDHLALLKWPQIWHKGAQSHAKWCLHHALPIWFVIFKKLMQKL